jgi:hypothetical protein
MFNTLQSKTKRHSRFTFVSLLTACMLFCMAFSLGFSNKAHAVSGSSDYSGLWWNAAESGWGMNVMQQEQILFITLFIYGTGNAPTWYVASNVSFASANAAGDRTYTGALYATTGTPFGTNPFVPSSVTVTQPGNITFVGKADGTATVQYNVGATTVNKALVRQTWAQPTNPVVNVAQPYAMAQYSTTTGCANASDNGAGATSYGASGETDDGSRFSLFIGGTVGNGSMVMNLTPPRASGLGACQFSGAYTQEGRYGKATLTGRCSTQPASWTNITWNMTEIEIGKNFATMQFNSSGGPSASCRDVGTFAGPRFPN